MDKHREAVAQIAADVRGFYDRKESFRIYHGATNSTRLSKYQMGHVVDTSGLNSVLKLDQKARTALVEPNVPMDHLVECTMKYGLIPPVVMEFPGITVGGLTPNAVLRNLTLTGTKVVLLERRAKAAHSATDSLIHSSWRSR